MSQPKYVQRLHTPEVAAKRGARKSAWFAAGSPKALAELERIRGLNPMSDPACRLKVSKTLQAMGHRPPWTGGKGRGLTVPQKMLLEALGEEWRAEFAVPVRPRQSDLPTCFYIDLALPAAKLAVEVDGSSHRIAERKEQDRKKEAYLEGLGWRVIRFWNDEILSDLDGVVRSIAACEVER